MKTIRRNILTIMLLIGIVFISACQKYPDGPIISFHSEKERVSNNWKVEKYIKDGTDYTADMIGYTETYTTDGNYSYLWGNHSGTGIWNFQNSDKEIELIGISHQDTRTLYILKLEEKAFWYYYIDGNDKKEIHLIPN